MEKKMKGPFDARTARVASTVAVIGFALSALLTGCGGTTGGKPGETVVTLPPVSAPNISELTDISQVSDPICCGPKGDIKKMGDAIIIGDRDKPNSNNITQVEGYLCGGNNAWYTYFLMYGDGTTYTHDKLDPHGGRQFAGYIPERNKCLAVTGLLPNEVIIPPNTSIYLQK